jgi:malate dehydrogenase
MIVAIVGAGPLATALASTLAARGRVRHVRLIDDAGTVAAGKALDVRQSTPVLGSDVSIDATADIAAAADADAIVIADARRPRRGVGGRAGPGARRPPPPTPAPRSSARRASVLVERGVTEVRLPWTRILGSASIAFDAAARAVVAEAAETAPSAVALGLAGLPPSRLVVGWSASSIDGVPAETRLAPGVSPTPRAG